MFTIPCPEKVVIATESSSGLGRRLPYCSTSQCVIAVKQEIWADAVPAWNHWQRPEERFPRIVADRLFHGTKNQAEKKLILEERIPSRRYSWRRGYPAYSSDGEFVSEFHSCPLALRSGHSRKQNRAIGSCGSTNYEEWPFAYSYWWISWRYLLCFYEVIAMVTSWPLTSRTALKWKKLTRFFYHEWLLDVVVEDWDIRPILLMHFLKWICKWFSSLRSRRLEVAGERENGRARGRIVFSCAHCFQAPATQASDFLFNHIGFWAIHFSRACLISSEEYFVVAERTTIGSKICSPFLAPKKL